MAVQQSFEGFRRLWKYLLHLELAKRKTFIEQTEQITFSLMNTWLETKQLHKDRGLHLKVPKSAWHNHWLYLRVWSDKSDTPPRVNLGPAEAAEFGPEISMF